VAALLRRGRTGEGAYIDLSMLQSLWAADDVALPSVLNGGAPLAGPRAGMVVHAVGGRWIALQTVGAGHLWPRLLQVMQRPDLAADPRFATPVARREHWTELRAIIGDWLDGFASAEAALAALTGARIPCAPVLSPAEVVAHPHLAERGAFATVPHPGRGEVRITSAPFQVDGAPVAAAGAAPYRVGEHTRAVLRDVLGYSDERVESLQKAGVIAAV
jgi:crotonobetainyl-CoA:carnitine CoA-transferase CaiB-like acyl-CoA transferase